MNAIWRQIRPYLSVFVRYLRISYLEARSNYEDTYLGLLWLPLSTIVFSGVLALIFRHSASMTESEFFLYVLVGYVIWNFIDDSINGSTTIIQSKFDAAVANNLTLLGLFQKVLVDRLFEFGINLVVLVIVLVVVDHTNIGPQTLLFVPLMVLLSVTSLAVSYVVNLITVLYPDTRRLFSTLVRFVFFASPVFWVAEDRSGIRPELVRYNPISYFLRAGRQVFGIEPFDQKVWGMAVVISLICCALGVVAYRRSHGFVRNVK